MAAPDVDAIASAVAPEGRRDARARQAALQARQRLAEVRQLEEAAEDHAAALAARLAAVETDEQRVVSALQDRDQARLLREAWEMAVRAADDDPALRGRR